MSTETSTTNTTNTTNTTSMIGAEDRPSVFMGPDFILYATGEKLGIKPPKSGKYSQPELAEIIGAEEIYLAKLRAWGVPTTYMVIDAKGEESKRRINHSASAIIRAHRQVPTPDVFGSVLIILAEHLY